VGHLCFEVAGTTIAGDMVAGLGTILIDPSEGDMAVYIASLELMLQRPQGAILPAHGPTITDGHARLREYLAHRRMREDRVLASLTDVPQALADLVSVAYADTNPVMWRVAERSLLAHLVKLAGEGRAQDTGDGRWARYSARG
jgi:glyoxylase-like metal-dependent hydrolase (beta-lactamase superfamily II)